MQRKQNKKKKNQVKETNQDVEIEIETRKYKVGEFRK